MCGRFTVTLAPDQIGNLYDAAQPTLPIDLPPRYNGAPTQDFAACRLDESGRRLITRLRWGLVPSWTWVVPLPVVGRAAVFRRDDQAAPSLRGAGNPQRPRQQRRRQPHPPSGYSCQAPSLPALSGLSFPHPSIARRWASGHRRGHQRKVDPDRQAAPGPLTGRRGSCLLFRSPTWEISRRSRFL